MMFLLILARDCWARAARGSLHCPWPMPFSSLRLQGKQTLSRKTSECTAMECRKNKAKRRTILVVIIITHIYYRHDLFSPPIRTYPLQSSLEVQVRDGRSTSIMSAWFPVACDKVPPSLESIAWEFAPDLVHQRRTSWDSSNTSGLDTASTSILIDVSDSVPRMSVISHGLTLKNPPWKRFRFRPRGTSY